jgi:hypothetical protein
MDKHFYDLSLLFKFDSLVESILEERDVPNVGDMMIFDKSLLIKETYLYTYIKFVNSYILYTYTDSNVLTTAKELLECLIAHSDKVTDPKLLEDLQLLFREYFTYMTNIIFKSKMLKDSMKCLHDYNESYVEGALQFLDYYSLLFKTINNQELKEIVNIDTKRFCKDFGYTKALCFLIKKLK